MERRRRMQGLPAGDFGLGEMPVDRASCARPIQSWARAPQRERWGDDPLRGVKGRGDPLSRSDFSRGIHAGVCGVAHWVGRGRATAIDRRASEAEMGRGWFRPRRVAD